MNAIDLRFAAGHTLSHTLRILLEGETFAVLTTGRRELSLEAEVDVSDASPFARYAFMDSATRNREFAKALHSAARRIEAGGGLEAKRRQINPPQFANQLVEMRVGLDKHGVPYDFFADKALEHAAQKSAPRTPHLSDISGTDVLDHVVRQWNDPAVRSSYPLQLSSWDRRFRRMGKAGASERRLMYEVIQQRVADVAARGVDPTELLRPLIGRYMPLAEAAVRFSPALVQALQQPAAATPATLPTHVDALPEAAREPRKQGRIAKPEESLLEWAQSTCPSELARLARKELAARSEPKHPLPQPREKSARQQADARRRMLDLAAARALQDDQERRTAVDGWVRSWISRELLEAEPTASAAAWPGYRHLSPLERTELFTQAYIEVYRQLHSRYIDADEGPKKQPVAAAYARNGVQTMRALWKARALADALGLPYDLYLGAVMERKLANGKWKRPPRPTQVYSDLDLARARAERPPALARDDLPALPEHPSCFGFPHGSEDSPCRLCAVGSACRDQKQQTLLRLRSEMGTDDPELKRRQSQSAARSRNYRERKKASMQRGP